MRTMVVLLLPSLVLSCSVEVRAYRYVRGGEMQLEFGILEACIQQGELLSSICLYEILCSTTGQRVNEYVRPSLGRNGAMHIYIYHILLSSSTVCDAKSNEQARLMRNTECHVAL